jgi:monofunctional chorismate mutase
LCLGEKMNLNECRKEIDEIDTQIVALLNRRGSIAKEIGMTKAKAGLPIIDRHRENEILTKITRQSEGVVDDAMVMRIYGEILFESRRIQKDAINEIARNGVGQTSVVTTPQGVTVTGEDNAR